LSPRARFHSLVMHIVARALEENMAAEKLKLSADEWKTIGAIARS